MNDQRGEKEDMFEMILEVENGKTSASAVPFSKEKVSAWHAQHQEGQLSVDVVSTEEEVVVVAPMAGADTGSIEVYVHNDLLTIRGMRNRPQALSVLEEEYHRECYWGAFSRTVVLPVDVRGESAYAEYTNGILLVSIPKHRVDARIPITIVEE